MRCGAEQTARFMVGPHHNFWAPGKAEVNRFGSMIQNGGVDRDIHEVAQEIEQARSAIHHNDWDTAERALVGAQDRIGRLLREIDLKRDSLQINKPPSSTKGGLGQPS
jgi:hypothetical protein